MFDKPTSLHTIGLEREDGMLRAAQLTLKRGQPALERLCGVPLAQAHPSDHVNPLYIGPEDELLHAALTRDLVVTVLETPQILVRPLEIKLKKARDINAVLAFQAEPLLPYPIENAILDKIVLEQGVEGSRLTLLAARKDHVQQHLANWEQLQITPEVISCVPVALAFFSQRFSSTTQPHFVVHLGLSSTTCALVQGGKLWAAQAFDTGLQSLFHAVSQDLPDLSLPPIEALTQLDYLNLSSTDTPQLLAALDNWRRELMRLFYALGKQSRDCNVDEVLLTGDGSTIGNLGLSLTRDLNKPPLTPINDPLFPVSPSQLQQYAVPIGAALSALPTAKESVNFRQQEMAYADPWKRLKQPLSVYAAACLGVALALFIFGKSYVGYQQDQLRQEYVDLLATINKPYATFEKEYLIKHPSSRRGDEELLLPSQLHSEEIATRLQMIQKELREAPNTFPLQPNIPRVSDVLAWISNHPKVVGQSKDEEGNPLPPLQIESFSYALAKRPDLKKPQEHYQVKVELEFSSPTPKLAREFHDALIAPNDLVDPKGEVKWSSNRGRYRTSFFLKDKTVYPGG